MPSYDVVGKSNIRYDAIPKSDGSMPYGEDHLPDGALHCGVLFTPVPHGRLKRIDTAAAERIPGVAAVLTAKDIPGKNFRFGSNTATHEGQPVLVEDVIEFTGDALAVVGAETRDALEAGIAAIKLEIEAREGVWTTRHGEKSAVERRVCDFEVVRGDPKAAFAEADVIIERTYETQLAEHAFLEPASGTSWLEEDGVLTIRVGTQLIEYYRAMAMMLGIPQSRVRHLGTYVGGGFGAKGMLTVEPYLALMTHLTRRPAHMVMGREEGFRSTSKKHPFVMHYRTAASKEGKILAVEADVVGDAGAYPYKSNLFLLGSMCIATGPYEVPNAEIRCHGYLTNNPITNAMRGVGSNQLCFAYENQMNLVAEALGMDPFELRRRNFLQKGGQLVTGQKIEYGPGLEECLDGAIKALGEPAKPAPGKRIGQGVAANITGYGRPMDSAEAAVHMEPDGSAVVRVSAPDIGAGQGATLQTLAAESLGLRLDQVSTRLSDSASTPLSGITAGSRQTLMAGNALKLAADEIRKSLIKGAATLLEASESDIRLGGGEAWVSSAPDRRVPVGQAAGEAKKMGESLHCTHGYNMPGHDYENPERYMGGMGGWADYTFGVHASEVEVDIDTGEVNLLKHVAAHEIGIALNPTSVEGQFEGGAVMGIGYTLHEEMTMTEGDCRSQSFHEYLIPTSEDVGDFKNIVLEGGEGAGPYGARGVGEPPCNNAPAAVALAINDAIGGIVYELPITPERVFRTIREKKNGGSGR
jgi:CO/xanthine dehydrogenase Mo-binding subunit